MILEHIRKMEIKIKTLTGTNYRFDIDDTTTLADVKMYILTKTGILLNQQRYIYCGKLINDMQCIAKLPDAAQGMVLNMILSLRGG